MLGLGMFTFTRRNALYEPVYREDIVLNTVADEGMELFAQLLFQNATLTAFFMGLCNDTLVETDTLATMIGEPSTNGYARKTLTRDGTDFPTLAKNIASDSSGTAQAGTATEIQLASGAITSDDEMNECVIELTGGTGRGQFQVITASVAATDTCTVQSNWKVNPDATTTYTVHSDFVLESKVSTFTASGGSWGPVNTMFLCNVETGTAGKLCVYGALSSSQTPSAGESILVTYKRTMRSGL